MVSTPVKSSIRPKACCRSISIPSLPGRYGTATREDLLRVPGFGTSAVDRIITIRRVTSIRIADLARLRIPGKKALPFIILSDHRPPPHLLDSATLTQRFKPKAAQLGFGF